MSVAWKDAAGIGGSSRVPDDSADGDGASKWFGDDRGLIVMTERELEIAARKYCELAGIDPDAIGGDESEWKSQWHYVVPLIQQQLLIQQAIEFVRSLSLQVSTTNSSATIG